MATVGKLGKKPKELPRAAPKYKGLLERGEEAPDFEAAGSDGQVHTLASLLKQSKKGAIVLYFYPKDETPGCTTEACSFRDSLAGIGKKGAIVAGVSPDNVEAHRKFADKYKLPFVLLADTDKKIAKAYGVWQNRGIFGWGISRATYLIKKGKIARVFRQVSPEGHGKQVERAL